MKAKVIENLCIGCGACQAIAPNEFELNDNGIAESIHTFVKKGNEEVVVSAKDGCPTGAIAVETEEIVEDNIEQDIE